MPQVYGFARWVMAAVSMVGCGQLMVGCATVAGGTSQNIEIASRPTGATVLFSPSGQTVTTPATIKLDRSTDHVAVFQLSGHEDVRVRINRAPRQAVIGSAWIPILGPAALAVDAASDAEFELHPDVIDVVLPTLASKPPDFAIESTSSRRVIVFNRNAVVFSEIYFAFNGGEPCKLDKWQMTPVHLEQGSHKLTVYHWDLFKFSDNYEMEMPDGVSLIGVFSGVNSTNFSYYDELPQLENEFTEVTCKSEHKPKASD